MAKNSKAKGSFFERKDINFSLKTYFIDAMGAMAFGLFASLLIGTIFNALCDWTGVEFFGTVAGYAQGASGAAIGIAIAYTLKAPALVLYSCAAVGMAGYALGGPVGTYVAVIVATELGKIVSKETKIDIILTPTVTLCAGTAMAMWVGPYISQLMTWIGQLIMAATEMQPLLMGIIVSVVVGMVLTLPISSAALCIMLGLSGIAAGAATAGCCAQMIGFAVMSFSDNRWGGLAAQGLGTSMLQVPNIFKRPIIWLPPILASAVTGALSTCVYKLENIPTAAGMGTCGLVGPLGIITAMPNADWFTYLGIALICFILPAVLTPLFALPLRRIGWIRPGDMLLEAGN